MKSKSLQTVSNEDYGVGFVDLSIEDHLMRVYYPCQLHDLANSTNDIDSISPWFPPERGYIDGFGRAARLLPGGRLLKPLIEANVRQWASQVQTPCKHKAPVAYEHVVRPLPVLVISPCYTGTRFTSTGVSSALVCTLGCVVIVLEHSDGSAAWTQRQGHSIKLSLPSSVWRFRKKVSQRSLFLWMTRERAKEIAFVCDQLLPQINNGTLGQSSMDTDFDWTQFKGQLNVLSINVLGHGLGAAAACLAAVQGAQRLTTIIALDGSTDLLSAEEESQLQNSQVRVLFVNSDGHVTNALHSSYHLLSTQPQSRISMITLKSTDHMHFCDLCRFVPAERLWQFSGNSGTQPDPVTVDELTADCIMQWVKLNHVGSTVLWPSHDFQMNHHDQIFVPISPQMRREL